MKYLPPSIAGKQIGSLSIDNPVLGADLSGCECDVIPTLPYTNVDQSSVAAFVLDCTSMLHGEYPREARAALEYYAKVADARYCYAVFPYTTLNYEWDVINLGRPHAGMDLLPGARWLYDTLLCGFAARGIAHTKHEETNCVVTRLLPLDRTLMCIMAQSGQGKTTFVRQLKNQHNIFHTSSDYLLSTIDAAELKQGHSEAFLQLKSAINEIPKEELWSRFFRLLDEDHTLLLCFLEVAWQHFRLASSNVILSFDIDLRIKSSKEVAKGFFREKNLVVWDCSIE